MTNAQRDDLESRSQTIAAVERAADVLLHVAQSPAPAIGVTDIASDLGMSKAVVHRILMSLKTRGLVEADPETRKYRIGPMALRGLAALNRLNLREQVAPALRYLAEVTGETATFSVRSGFARIYVDQVTPNREVIMSVAIGVAFPLHAGASSKAFLAFLSDDEREQYLNGPLTALTERTITSVSMLRRELREIRKRGWALSNEERQRGAAAVAAPILDHRGEAVGVISVGGPAERFMSEVEFCTRHLMAQVRDISHRIGHPGPLPWE